MGNNNRNKPKRRGKPSFWSFLVLVLIVALWYFGPELGLYEEGDFWTIETPRQMDKGLWVSYIDVGQGDSTLIICDGEAMLIDAGIVAAGETVTKYLDDCGVRELEYVICTHAHEDHCGGLDDVVKEYEVKTLFAPYTEFDASGTFTYFERAAAERGIYITVPPIGGVFTLGGASFTIIGPVSDYEDVNDTSIIVLLEYGDTRFLFTGDAGSGALLDSAAIGGFDISCDVLKLGHHGSSGSTNKKVLELTNPQLAIASCGKDNRYGHPHKEVQALLESRQIPLLRTDQRGTIVLYSEGVNVYDAEYDTLPDAA